MRRADDPARPVRDGELREGHRLAVVQRGRRRRRGEDENEARSAPLRLSTRHARQSFGTMCPDNRMTTRTVNEPPWWQGAAIYQIYPRSFADSNGDGVGDLRGHHARRLDYLALRSASTRSGSRRSTARRWPTSATTSPTTRTSTRCSARSPTSTRCVAEAHARGIRVVIDWVPNHSSDQHPWFLESRRGPRQPQARLVRVARPGARRRTAEQLALELRGRGRRGRSTRRAASTTCTRSCPSSPS